MTKITKFDQLGAVTRMGQERALWAQPRHCICTSAEHELLVNV